MLTMMLLRVKKVEAETERTACSPPSGKLVGDSFAQVVALLYKGEASFVEGVPGQLGTSFSIGGHWLTMLENRSDHLVFAGGSLWEERLTWQRDTMYWVRRWRGINHLWRPPKDIHNRLKKIADLWLAVPQ